MKTITLVAIALILVSVEGIADEKAPELVRWSTEAGIDRLESSEAKVDFFPLANQFESQKNALACGPTTGAIVLNALRPRSKDDKIPFTSVEKPLLKHVPKTFDPRLQRYTPESFFTDEVRKIKSEHQMFGKPIKGKQDFGFQLRQFYKALMSHGVDVKLRVVSDKLDVKKIKREIIKNLESRSDYVIVNYARKSFGQPGGGHISPLGAYEAKSDSVLILDVNANKDEWVWAKLDDLIAAMRTKDTIENRGYLLVSEK